MTLATNGTWLSLDTLATDKPNCWLTLAPEESVAVILRLRLPISPLAGVPLKLLVIASKLSHVGSGLPLARVAVNVRLSPASTSLKLLAGTTNEKDAFSVVV